MDVYCNLTTVVLSMPTIWIRVEYAYEYNVPLHVQSDDIVHP
jgi:hypothetical protein